MLTMMILNYTEFHSMSLQKFPGFSGFGLEDNFSVVFVVLFLVVTEYINVPLPYKSPFLVQFFVLTSDS